MDDVGRRLNASYPDGFTENNPSTAASAPVAADAQVPPLKRPRAQFSRAAGQAVISLCLSFSSTSSPTPPVPLPPPTQSNLISKWF